MKRALLALAVGLSGLASHAAELKITCNNKSGREIFALAAKDGQVRSLAVYTEGEKVYWNENQDGDIAKKDRIAQSPDLVVAGYTIQIRSIAMGEYESSYYVRISYDFDKYEESVSTAKPMVPFRGHLMFSESQGHFGYTRDFANAGDYNDLVWCQVRGAL